jgi:hypothetical protein
VANAGILGHMQVKHETRLGHLSTCPWCHGLQQRVEKQYNKAVIRADLVFVVMNFAVGCCVCCTLSVPS